MNESLHLAAREFDTDTAAQLSSLSIGIAHTQSSSPKPRNRRAPHTPGAGANGIPGGSRYPDTPVSARAARTGEEGEGGIMDGDEIDRARYLARINSFMRHRDSDSDDDDDDNGRGRDGDEDDFDDEHRGGADGDGDGDGSPRHRGRRIPVGDIGFDEDGDDDEAGGMFDLDEAEVLDYAGASGTMGDVDGRMQGGGGGGGAGSGPGQEGGGFRRTGAGEEVDEYGEDDERFAEGNDEYELGGGGLGVEGGRQVGAG